MPLSFSSSLFNYMATKTLQRETHTLDATDQSLGRLASEIAKLLRGKHVPSWVPHIDAGGFVEVINAKNIKFTGKKMTDKIYYRHSQHPGGLKQETLEHRIERKGYGTVLEDAVYNMLPKNRLRQHMMKRLTIKDEQA